MPAADILARVQKLAIDNSPQILTAIGVVGTVSTAVLAGKATVVDAVGTGVPDGAPGSTALVVTLAGMFAAARICSRKQVEA